MSCQWVEIFLFLKWMAAPVIIIWRVMFIFSLYKGRSRHLASTGAITFTVVSIE
jgi:hypothetical protein